MRKKMLSLALALAMCLGLTVPAFAAESKWKLAVSGKTDAQVFVGERTFTVRDWDCSEPYEDEENGLMETLTKTDSHAYTAANLCVMEKGDIAVFTKGGETFTGLVVTAWSDPDGDGVYDERAVTDYEGTLPVDTASPLHRPIHLGGDYYGANYLTFYMPGSPAYSDEYGGFDLVFGDTAIVTELKIPADYLLEMFGPNTLVVVEDFDGDNAVWSCDILVGGNAAQPQQPTDPKPTTPTVTVEDIPASGTAKVNKQNIEIDGKAVAFQTYMLLDANGNGTNYVKLRDVAHVLNGTKAQFSVDYDGSISLTSGAAYQDNGSEMSTPFSGDRAYTGGAQSIKVNGSAVDMTAITLLDDQGGGYNYFKLRDLGKALGFNVGWTSQQGVYIETDKPYVG